MARVHGLGTILKVDDDDSGSVFTTISLLLGFEAPKRIRERVENTALEDTLATEAAGIEIAGDVVFEFFRDPGATQDLIFNTLFTNKTQVLWQCLYSDNGTETFEGIVMGIEPLGVMRNGFLREKITIARQTAKVFA